MKTNDQSVVLFDGVCNLCNSSVNFLLDRDKNDHFRFGSLQSKEGEALLNEYSIDREDTESVILIENGKAFAYSTAALRIARGLGGIWSLGYVFIVIPKFIRDPLYKLIAKNRYRMFGKREMCRMPTPEERAKFI
jgi:predicted DCC family thiol-disulfide oxidoreductase YuxK